MNTNIKVNDIYVEKVTDVFFLVTKPYRGSIQMMDTTRPMSVTECIQYPSSFHSSAPHHMRGAVIKVYVDLSNSTRFIPVRLNNVIVNEDLFTKFLEVLLKGDLK